MSTTRSLFFSLTVLFCVDGFSQKEGIQWINFEQLDDSLKIKPKKVFISFYADWCVYCKKMEQSAFKDKTIIQLLQKDYYAVKMDAESKDSIFFEGKLYINKNIGKSRKPTHEFPLLLASRNGAPFTLPANIILDKNFSIRERFFEYLSPKELINILRN